MIQVSEPPHFHPQPGPIAGSESPGSAQHCRPPQRAALICAWGKTCACSQPPRLHSQCSPTSSWQETGSPLGLGFCTADPVGEGHPPRTPQAASDFLPAGEREAVPSSPKHGLPVNSVTLTLASWRPGCPHPLLPSLPMGTDGLQPGQLLMLLVSAQQP